MNELTSECRMWLREEILRNTSNAKEIRERFFERFPYFSKRKLSVNDIKIFAKEVDPDWVEPNIEDVIEREINREYNFDDLLSKEDSKKINQIKTHRRILKEIWDQYLSVKDKPRADTSKARFLEQASRELQILSNLEEEERGILSMFDEIKKKEEQETPDENRSYIEGWCLQILAKKCKTKKESLRQLSLLEEKIRDFKEIIKTKKTIEEAIKQYLFLLYPAEKVIEEKEG